MQDKLIKAENGRTFAEIAKEVAIDLLCDCANQFLMSHENGILFHSFMSTEERLCDYLVSIGKLIPVKRGHFKWAPAGNGSTAGANTAISGQPDKQESPSHLPEQPKNAIGGKQ